MKKLSTLISSAVCVVGFSVLGCPQAVSDTFGPCPYDPSDPASQTQYFNQKTAELVALQNDVNTRILGGMSSAEKDAWAASPAGAAALAQMQKIVYDRDHPPDNCVPLQSVSALPSFNPGPLAVPDKPLIVDSLPDADAEAPVDCTQLRRAYDSLGPVLDTADAAAKLNHLRVPGLSQVTGLHLAMCGLDAIPAALESPSSLNQQRVFDGACGGIEQVTNGLINICGDTPVGSN